MRSQIPKVEKRIDVIERRYEGVLSYGGDNNYPNWIRDIVAASTMGTSCLSIYKKFIFGKGFKDEKFAASKINRWGDTADKILSKLKDDYAACGGFTLHLNYDASFQVTDISYQPFSQVRKTTNDSEYPGMYAVYRDWGAKRIDKNKIIYVDKFNPDPDVIAQQVINAGGWNNYKGQIYYYSPCGDEYPLAIYDAAREDMITDSKAKVYKYRNITDSFLASHIVTIPPIEGADPEAIGDQKDELLKSLSEFQGADNASKILLLEKSNADQEISIDKLDQQQGDKLYEYTEQSTRDNIRQSFFIPPALIMMQAGKLGTADEIIDGTKTYNSYTEDERLAIESVFEYLSAYAPILQTTDFSIAPRDAIRKEEIPSELMKDLTTNERRALIGYEELPEGSEQTLAQKLQVGGTASFVEIVKDPALSPEQKAGTLKVLFNLSDEQITALNLDKEKEHEQTEDPQETEEEETVVK